MKKTPARKKPSKKIPLPAQANQWYVALARLLTPLTPDQQDDLRDVFGNERRQDADQLLRDWKRIGEVAHHHALILRVDMDSKRILVNDRTTRKRRDTQLRRAATAADQTCRVLGEMVRFWSPHLDLPSSDSVSRWADGTRAQLAQYRDTIQRYRVEMRALPRALVKTGRPEQPAAYRLTVLAAYFRHHGWQITSGVSGLFALVAQTVTPRRDAVDYPRLKAAVASRHSYTTLDAKAPSIGAAERGHHAAYARRTKLRAN